MLNDILGFFQGSCRFRAEGDFPERFLNLCARSDLGLRNIDREENGLSAVVAAGRYRRLLPIARRCGLRLRVLERSGLPFRLLPYRKRAGMPLGFAMFCGMLWFLSLFVWSVQLPELSPEVSAKVTEALDVMGVRVGSLRSELDGNRMSVELQLKVPDLTWAGISVYGSRVTVEAKEFRPVVSNPGEGQPRNLTASRDGVIIDVEPLRGSVEVEPGQAVIKGDLLVSGVVEHLDGSVQITDATARVWAATTRELSCSMPFRQLARERTGRVVTRHRVRLFGLELPLLLSADTDGLFEREYSHWQPKVGTIILPLEVSTERCYELEEREVDYSPEQAEQQALEELERRIRALGCEVLERRVSTRRSETDVRVTLSLTVRENIAQPSKISISQ